MSEQYKATPEEWASIETRDTTITACILELRARVEALESAQQPTVKEVAPASSLVKRVQRAIGHSYPDDARAAIREVAAWLIDRRRDDDWLAPFEELAELLQEEADQ